MQCEPDARSQKSHVERDYEKMMTCCGYLVVSRDLNYVSELITCITCHTIKDTSDIILP